MLAWTAVLLAWTGALLKSAAAAGEPLLQPPSVSSVNGVLETVVSFRAATLTTPDYTVRTRTFNGSLPGPTLRLNAGDTLIVEFLNDLEPSERGSRYEHNRLSAPDDSNLHYHGLHVSGELPSDDATVVVSPGDAFTYTSRLPTSHMGGTHWLHPHRHGSTSVQLAGGAATAIIVEDPPGYLPPEVEGAEEVIMVVQRLQWAEAERLEARAGGAVFQRLGGTGAGGWMVNGQVRPVIETDAQRWMRLRIVYADWDQGALRVAIPGCEMHLLAKDGIYIRDFPREIDEAFIFLGGRADVIVRCAAEEQSFTVMNGAVQLASISTSSSTSNSSQLEPWAVEYPPYLQDLSDVEPSRGCDCGIELERNAVNGARFEYDVVLHESYLGAVVQRDIRARDHPYHQHVYPFQVVGGIRGDTGYDRLGDWHDTFDGAFTMRYNPREFASKVMLHCHRLEHEDEGMMAVEYVREASVGECTCTRVPGGGLRTRDLVVVLLASLAGVVALYGSVAWCRNWFPFHNPKPK